MKDETCYDPLSSTTRRSDNNYEMGGILLVADPDDWNKNGEEEEE